MYSGKISADRRPEKYISTEMNLKKGSLQSQNPPPKGNITFIKKALRRAPYKLFGIFKVHELLISL
jgi:hypothetical protein